MKVQSSSGNNLSILKEHDHQKLQRKKDSSNINRRAQQ
jgi:hypothetical protein